MSLRTGSSQEPGMLPCSWGVLENPAGIHIHVVEPQQASRKIRNAGCPRLVPWPETFLWFISDAFNFEKSSQVNVCLFLLSSKVLLLRVFGRLYWMSSVCNKHVYEMWKKLGTTLGSITTTSWAVLPQRPLSIFVFEAS